ncbi:MAG: hypothetical protein K0B15_08315 [Lentimicrobium sp.]|nr:hypothetical protein [Lentimicrobium sp.]
MYSDLHVFRSGILRSGNPFSRDVFVIGPVYITFKKKGLFLNSDKTISIPLSNITNVNIHKSFTGNNIHIESKFQRSFTGHGFSDKMAIEIKKALEPVLKKTR